MWNLWRFAIFFFILSSCSSDLLSLPDSHFSHQAETPVTRNSSVKDGVSLAEVVRSSPLQCHPQSLSSSKTSSSFKRRRSPDSGEVCKRCLRSGHKVDGCRHQLTCWRCSGIGHFAVRCPLRSPPRASTASEKAPPSYKKQSLTNATSLKPLIHVPARPSSSSFKVSLPIS